MGKAKSPDFDPLLQGTHQQSRQYHTFGYSPRVLMAVNMKAADGTQDPVDSNSEEGALPDSRREPKRVWYRSVPFQIAVASGVSFTAPGMWDALGGLGAGGAAEPVSKFIHSKNVPIAY